jgi:hypothetical protein
VVAVATIGSTAPESGDRTVFGILELALDRARNGDDPALNARLQLAAEVPARPAGWVLLGLFCFADAATRRA